MTTEEKAALMEELNKEATSLIEQNKLVKEEIAALEPTVRANLLNEFDEAMAQVTIASDDYRNQELRFIHAFSQTRETLANHLKSLREECAALKGEKQ